MLILLLSLNLMNSAQALDLPEFSRTPLYKMAVVPFDRARVKNFRVQVFPHLGAYSTPQGRESVVSSVKITSSVACTSYQAVLDADQEWTKGAVSGVAATTMSLRAGAAKATYYECSKPFTINRAAPLKSVEYSGDYVAVTTPSQVQIINIVDPDTYIKGVIPSEVLASWPLEVLKVQAVAARTYAWWSVVQSRATRVNSDMDDTVSYQAYMGNSGRTTDTDAAADQTEGLVLLYNGDIIKAYFSADSGGYSEDSSEVFEALPYCVAKPESFDVSVNPTTAWTKVFTAEAIRVIFANAGILPRGVTVKNVMVNDSDRNTSGRAKNLTVLGSNGRTYSMAGPAFRYASKVRSTLFSVTQVGTNVTFTGKGFGHGVGMAQIGALQYVNQLHWTYDQILKFLLFRCNDHS